MSVPTLNLTYLSSRSLAASFQGAPIKVRVHGQLAMVLKVPSIAGSPNGLFSLEGRLNVADPNDWRAILGAYSELPGAGTSGALAATVSKLCVWSGLNFEEVRLAWAFTSGAGTCDAYFRSR